MTKMNRIVFLFLPLLFGCGTSSGGVIPIGPNMYMLGGLGRFMDYSSSAVKADMYKQASDFCLDKGRVMFPITSTGKDSDFGTYASAEVQFSCLEPNDPRLKN